MVNKSPMEGVVGPLPNGLSMFGGPKKQRAPHFRMTECLGSGIIRYDLWPLEFEVECIEQRNPQLKLTIKGALRFVLPKDG